MKLEKKLHNELFKYRQKNLKYTYNFVEDGDNLLVYQHPTVLIKVFVTLMLPFAILWIGIPETFREYQKLYTKECGTDFISDPVIVKIIKANWY